ncbi:hypothetical protein DWW03_11275 [Alistipes sp. AF14-19]|nr:hypothetical protein DWW03_11275 [Alistipes sp. AF14-19]
MLNDIAVLPLIGKHIDAIIMAITGIPQRNDADGFNILAGCYVVYTAEKIAVVGTRSQRRQFAAILKLVSEHPVVGECFVILFRCWKGLMDECAEILFTVCFMKDLHGIGRITRIYRNEYCGGLFVFRIHGNGL